MVRKETCVACGILLLLFLICLAGCDGGMATLTPQTSPGPNLLIAAEGQILLKRAGWREYVPVTLGAEIRRGDLIRPEENTEVTILCADLSLRKVTRESGCPCRVTTPVLAYGETHIMAPRAAGGEIPYILHPRRTLVLEECPRLRWHDTGAVTYTVGILRGGTVVWQEEGVRGSELRYPDNAPPLEPEVDYLLFVVDGTTGRHSGEDPAKGLGFRLIGPEARAEVLARRDQIMALPLDDTARRFALALYYAGAGLRGESLALLEEVDPDLPVPAVPLRCGDLLLQVSLPQEAQAAYEEALRRAEAAGDPEAQALAHVGLWRATGAEDHREAAIALYEALGDKKRAGMLQQEAQP